MLNAANPRKQLFFSAHIRLLIIGKENFLLRLFLRRNYPCFVPRFQPDKEFAGTDRNQRRDGPVQFEKEEEDPFGLDKFLTEAKKGKRPLDEPSRSRYWHYSLATDQYGCEGITCNRCQRQ